MHSQVKAALHDNIRGISCSHKYSQIISKIFWQQDTEYSFFFHLRNIQSLSLFKSKLQVTSIRRFHIEA